MKELLEPIYLNEKMLLNCAGYLFDGVETSTNISQSNNDQSTKTIEGSGGIGTNGVLEWLAKAEGNLKGTLDLQNANNYSKSSTKHLTFGALHMKVLKKLYEDKLINKFEGFGDDLKQSPYIAIEADLQPVDFFELLQILKMLTPQLKYITAFLNKSNANNSTKKQSVSQNQLNNDLLEIVKNLISELETNYLESNLLEMLMSIDGKCIGVIDLDLENHQPNKIKSQLNDGNFIIIGKITKIINENQTINLLQRNVITPLLSLVERISLLIETINSSKEDYQIPDSKISEILAFKNHTYLIINSLLDILIEGPAMRVRAMSICI
ncbi:hypothetical protein PYR77_09950 [Acinetobacter soli]|uniref:DUF6414 family protein n=2 Tax=Acinetobacter soli TaxID=487316 RepID=UPI00124FC390|nr:hypothetical protein [Acinetobacter soli]WEH91197.1 hypothetical protein PYR75_10370 [Acinetobacter soli]WEH97377.1 hypothetical protein PYR76_13720 [Acinetobacter soli]WEH99710.1 hypothetical protein PYR77_09950 [Acinetobacter soli]